MGIFVHLPGIRANSPANPNVMPPGMGRSKDWLWGGASVGHYMWSIDMPGENESPPADSGKLTLEKLISSELEGKLKAISGYDDMLWKIRSGYVAILYGISAIILGTEEMPNLLEIMADFDRSLSIFLLIGGFSLSALIIDSSYLAKKLKVIVTRDLLVKIVFDNAVNSGACINAVELMNLLRIAGETPIREISPEAGKRFRDKMMWNLILVLMPLYVTAPALAICLYVMI
jgi:hypothetical protein